MRRYADVLRLRDFRLLWIGATASIVGDGMSWVALLWLVYGETGSPAAAGWLVFAYGAPVVLGGLLAGPALDRFGARRLLVADSVARGIVLAAVPLLQLAGLFALWQAFAVAAVYGLLKMVPLAGVPTLIAAYVPAGRRNTANALETLSFSLGLTVAPVAGGLLAGTIGAANVLALDSATFFLFAALLAAAREPGLERSRDAVLGGLRAALRFVVAQPQIRFTTLMFAAYNVSLGAVFVSLAVYADRVAGGGAGTFGLLVAASSAGMLAGTAVVGAVDWRLPLGRSIAAAQLLAGVVVAVLATTPSLGATLVALAVHGLLSSPLTIWAQTIRMAVIPAELRGRVFALLRTTMQAGEPLGGAAGGAAISSVGLAATLGAFALVQAAPGLAGLLHPDLREPEPAPAG